MNACLLLLVAGLSLSGCVVGTVAKTAVDVVTLPVKVASGGRRCGDHEPGEADEKLGREMRKQDEERAKQYRLAESAAARASRFRRTIAQRTSRASALLPRHRI